MTSPLENAAKDAVDAADNTELVRTIQAVLAAQQINQPPAPAPAPARPEFDSKKWLTIGGLAIVGGLVASLFAIAVAIGAVSVAILALVPGVTSRRVTDLPFRPADPRAEGLPGGGAG